MRNHGNRFGIDKYDEVTGKNEKSKNRKADADRKLKLPTKSRAALRSGTVINYSRKSRNTARSRGQKR